MRINIKKMLQDSVGISNEDFDTFMSFPNAGKILENQEEHKKYHLVAEVIESKYCSAGLKPGQKYIISMVPAVILTEESDCPFCIRAISPIGNLIVGFWKAIPNEIKGGQSFEQIIDCLDLGIAKGGLGHVRFRVYAQKIK
jgi:uncharacterized repeat protein (TIGR04076 family)